MAYLDTAVTFIVIFALLVFFHELGHFLLAKLFRMPVEEFAIGFGKRVVRIFHDGETDYTLRAIPLGGFVRIAGMEFDELAEADGAPEPRSDGFNQRPIYQRFAVIFAGPLFSLILGYLGFVLLVGVRGVASGMSTRVERVVAGMPAAAAGIEAGDVVRRIDGTAVTRGEEVVRLIRQSEGKSLLLEVERAGARRVIAVAPTVTTDEGRKIARIGIEQQVLTRSATLGEALTEGGQQVIAYFDLLGQMFRKGKVKENVGGPIAIASMVRQSVDYGLPAKVALLAQLSLSLALFNLFPIPVLDGGHIVLLGLEGMRRGRKLTSAQAQRVFMTGFAILAMLFVYVMFNDITRRIHAG